jgi:site-specific recombinase XerD
MSHRGHGEGTIVKRKDGRFAASLKVNGQPRKWVYAKSRAEVQQKLAELIRLTNQGRLIRGTPETVGEYLTRWLQDTAKITVSPTTYVVYEGRVKRIIAVLGTMRLTALRESHIQACYATLLERLSPRTVQQTHTTLRKALQQAVAWDLLSRNPADAVGVPHAENREMQTLSATDLQRLLAVAQTERNHALWVVLATTGMRLGEALGLKWQDVSADRVMIRRTLHPERGKGLVLVEPKTKASRRTIQLGETARRALSAHRKHQVEERLQAGSWWWDQDLVFCNEFGGPLQERTVRAQFRRHLESANLPHIRIHDLRHTVATLLLQEGENPKIVQEMLGHSSITITLGIYSHVIPTMHKSAAAKLDALLNTKVS